MRLTDSESHQSQPADLDALMASHHAWQESRREGYIRLAAIDPTDEDEPAIYVDEAFAKAGLAVRGEYKPHIRRGPGRPRKHPVKP